MRTEMVRKLSTPWYESKDYLEHCNISKTSRDVIYLHYKNYVANRPKDDKFEIGRKFHETGMRRKQAGALFGFGREKALLRAIHNNKCYFCGKSEEQLSEDKRVLEFHHIEPLSVAGNNDITNIVPTCKHCHCKAHSKISVKSENVNKTAQVV